MERKDYMDNKVDGREQKYAHYAIPLPIPNQYGKTMIEQVVL